jgi:hypothetical protein
MRICPERDALCPHGMSCPFTVDRYTCSESQAMDSRDADPFARDRERAERIEHFNRIVEAGVDYGTPLRVPVGDASVIQPERATVASTGGATSYYELPGHATELRHLISHKGMSKSRGDIFKACYRLGEKSGTDTLYDLNKMRFFVEDLIEMYHRNERL